jgi:hypothetical protein
MYLTNSFSRYLKVTMLLLGVLVSLSSFSASAASKHKHHRHDTVVIHEVYVFNPRPVIAQNGQIIRNNISFNPQPVISVPTQRCGQASAVKQTVAMPINKPVPQKVQINYYND